jgi:hypothetical protein
MTLAKTLGLIGLACLATQVPHPPGAPARNWERMPAPGILYRMEVEDGPARVVHALRFDRRARQYWATSALATDEVYDLKPTNGRATMSQMIREAGAIGGVNGDFFQWGDDPGGDPLGLMVRHGELLSHPESAGVRGPPSAGGRRCHDRLASHVEGQ